MSWCPPDSRSRCSWVRAPGASSTSCARQRRGPIKAPSYGSEGVDVDLSRRFKRRDRNGRAFDDQRDTPHVDVRPRDIEDQRGGPVIDNVALSLQISMVSGTGTWREVLERPILR